MAIINDEFEDIIEKTNKEKKYNKTDIIEKISKAEKIPLYSDEEEEHYNNKKLK